MKKNSFRRDAFEKLIVNSRRLLKFAGETDNPMAIGRVILSVPRSDAELGEDGLMDRSFCMMCLAKAHDAAPDSNPQLEALADYFIDDLPGRSEGERRALEEAVGVLKGLCVEFPSHQESAALRLAI